MDNKNDAQARAEQIAAFNRELQQLEADQVFHLPESDVHKLNQYHSTLVDDLKTRFDIDATQTEKQLTIGMKIASFFGALAFSASIFFLFYQYWGLFSTVVQTVTLVSFPLAMLGLTYILCVREDSGYFAKIAGLLTFACFVLNLSMLGQIYNITPSPNAFALWGLLSLVLAYRLNARVLLVFAILCLAGFLSARMGTWFGVYWISFGDRPENFFIPALLLFTVGHYKHTHYPSFPAVYRVFAAIILLMSVLMLAHWSAASYLPFNNETLEAVYQVLGFALSAGLIWYATSKGWNDSINTGTVFFTIFLYTKFYDWWWEWMPKYLFFLVIAVSSVVILFIFKKLRSKYASSIEGSANYAR